MKLGAEPKKVGALVGLLAVAAVIVYFQYPDAGSNPAAAAPDRTAPAARQVRSVADQILETRELRPRSTQRATVDFKPSLKRSKPGEGPDPAKVDPTLRIELLTRAQGVGYAGVERNLFQFGAAKPKVTPPSPAEMAKAAAAAPKPASNEPPPAPTKPPPPPITMKYFGFANRFGDARKRAFFMDGEEIYIASEGEVIKKRYKVVRVGINSVVVEDLDHKSEQTLPLQES